MSDMYLSRHGFLKKDFISALVIIVNTFSWYFPLYFFFEDFLEKSGVSSPVLLATLSIHYLGAVGSAIAGTLLVRAFSNHNTFLRLWMLLGVIFSVMLLFLDANNVPYLLSTSFLLGVSLGLGFPSGLAYFGSYTREENRGMLGGITFFVSGISMLVTGLLVSIFAFELGVLFFTFWRCFGLVIFHLIKPKETYKETAPDVSYKSVLFDKQFILYLVPWVMFCLVNFLEVPIIGTVVGKDLEFLIIVAEYGIGGFSALIFGRFADSVGRKRIIILGFIIVGIGYAILGLFSGFSISWYLYMVLDGVAWGIFILMFYLVIWADLARNRAKEKYYLIGVLPFIVSGYIQILFTPYAESTLISVAFSLASFFLFLAVLPLLYAPETLSEKEMEKKRLSKYLDDAKRVKQRHEQ